MDEMQLLESYRSGVEVSDTSLLRARRRLLRAALVQQPSHRPSRRRRRVIALGVAAMVGLATALILTLMVMPGPQGAEPAAAATLERAAVAAASAPTAAPGEYLHWTSTTDRPGGDVYVQEAWVSADGRSVVRRDPDDVWISRLTPPALATDPDASADDIYEWLAAPNGDLRGPDAAFERLGETVVDEATPARFIARLFEVAKLIDGVELVDEAMLDGRAVAFLARTDGVSGLTTQLAFDTHSGAFVGFRGISPNGSISYTTLRTVEVVDRLPRSVAREGLEQRLRPTT